MRQSALLFAPLILASFLSLDAFAAQRAFVSASTGADTNTAGGCSLNAPCRWFAAAMSVVDANGEVVALDSGGYGQVTITKSVSIIAPEGVYVGISVFSGVGVSISAPSANVVLRGLSIKGLGGWVGVSLADASKLTIENCVISGFDGGGFSFGVAISIPADVRIVDSILRDNFYGAYISGGATASISGSKILGNGFGIYALSDAAHTSTFVTVADTFLGGNFYGVTSIATTDSTARSRVILNHSTVTASDIGLRQTTSSGASAVLETMGNNAVRGNRIDTDGTITAAPLI